MTPQTLTKGKRKARMGPLLGVHFLASMVSMFAMILAPDVRFVGMAALWLQLILPWVLVAYVGFLPQRFTFAAARAVTVPPNSIMILVLFSAAYNLAVGVAFTYVEVVSQGRLIALASVLALPLLGAMLAVDSRGKRSWNWLAVGLLAVASFSYSYWALRWINIVFDDSPQAAMSSVVARKFKGVWVRVQPWGPVRDAKAVQVPHVIYRVLQPNGSVCLVTRGGALGISWYTAQTCPWTGHNVMLGGADLWWLHEVDSRQGK
jgi:hypothetical protein